MQVLGLSVLLFMCAFIQVTSGFGFMLLAMPLVTLILGLDKAAPLVSAAGLLVTTANTLRLHRHIDRNEFRRIGLAGLAGIPPGFWLQAHIPADIVRFTLGLIIIGYAAYAILQPRGLRLQRHVWAYPAGLLAGVLGAAYNTAGPPVIVYGTLRQWPRDTFRSTLMTFFALNNAVVVAGHILLRHYSGPTLSLTLLVVPALIAGNLTGVAVDGHIDARRYQQIVKVLLLATGLALIV